MKRNVLSILVPIIFTLLLVSCGSSASGPSEEKIGELAVSKFNPLPNGIEQPYTVHKFKILNKYQKKVQGNDVYFYELEFKMKNKKSGELVNASQTQTPDGIIHMTLPVIKEGELWKYL